MTALLQDLRYAIRQLRLAPGFTLVAIASLALGIGANTAIFQLLDAVRLRTLPIHDPNELAEIRIVGGNKGFGITNGPYAQLTRPIWQEIQEHHEPFSGIFAWAPQYAEVGRGSDEHPISAIEVSGDFFSVLGIRPWRGRLIKPEDENNTCAISQLVASYSFWQSQMGGRELTGNETLIVEGRPAQVIGVTPPGFLGLTVGDSFNLAFPLCHPKEVRREVFDISVMGRLRPGWTDERASAQMAAMSAGILEATTPVGYSSQAIQQYLRYRLGVYPAAGGVSLLRTQYDTSLWLLLAITGLVLLIACANLANLMLARASVREREFAVRLALGASRVRLLRQSLAESGLLALVGTALGLGLAQLLSRLLIWSLSSEDNTITLVTDTDWRVLLFAASVAALTCLVFGVAPALRSISAQPVTAMKTGGRGMTGGGRERFSMQRLLVVTQISVSLVLLVGALLFVRSFHRLMTVDTGMRERGITLAFLGFTDLKLSPDRYQDFKRDLLNEVRSVPGVLDAATTTNVPLLGGSWTHNIHVGAAEGPSKFTWVSSDYFKTMGIPLQAGRGITDTDTATSPRIAVVNQAFIRQFLGGANPIGQTLRTSPEPQYPATVYEIVGVIPDTKYNDIRGGTPPMAFAPASQFPAPGPWTAMMIYSNTSPETAIKSQLAATYPGVTLNFTDFQADVVGGLKRERLLAMLSGFFGILAALLAMIGLYGVISYMIERRRNEIGVRVALGANRAQVLFMVMREAGQLLLLGVGIGTLLSLAAGRGAEALLFGLKPHDPISLFAAIALLSAIAALASFLPARRAAKVDPMVALRYE
jgi:predicted permease